MRIEWLYEAKQEYRALLLYYKNDVGKLAAERFSDKILNAVDQLESFPEMGILKTDGLMGKYGFRALFIEKYACIYRIEKNDILIYHLIDARTNYVYNIFGLEK